MKCDYLISAVDTHTGGAPTRIIYDPLIMNVPGNSMREKQDVIKMDYDFLRKALLSEPRGYREMTGVMVTSPVTNAADFGLIFLDTDGYLDLCGHAIVGAATAAFELSWVKPNKQEINFNTVSGLITVKVKYKDGKVLESIMQDVPSYSFGEVALEFEGKRITVDIAYAGNIFAILNASDFDIPANSEHVSEWSKLGVRIREKLNESQDVKKLTSGREVRIIEFSAPPVNKDANFRSIVVFGDGQIDREPCATGTCAKMACLFRKGKLKVGDSFLQESIINTFARATVVGLTESNGYKTIVPEVAYSVFVTGIHQYLIDETDPLKEGYLLY